MNLNFIRVATQKLGIYYKIANIYSKYVEFKYKAKTPTYSKELAGLQSSASVLLKNDLELTNKFPNSGGFSVDTETVEIGSLKKNILKNESRKTGNSEFEGMALDDAVSTVEWRHLSYFPLAKTLSQIAKTFLNKPTFSVLEVGCGNGGLIAFLKYLSASVYLGLDGNPLAFKHSPFINQHKNCFKLVNLQEEIDYNYKFDIVCTFEVLEHIKEEKTDEFIKTIFNHLGENSLFVGTISFSVMDVHINVHDKQWWLKKFASHQLKEHPESQKIIALLAENHPYNWSAENTHIFALKKTPQ